jgi:putative ABC transport system permease protein
LSLRELVPPKMYFPLAQLRTPPPASLTLSVRADRGPPAALIKSVSAAVVKVDPGISVTFRSLTDQIHASLAQERVVALLSGFVGGLAALLSGLGLFGITSYSVSRRRREIGIRMALGAAPTSVLGDVFSRVLVLVGIGLAIGAGVSLWVSPFLTPMLFGLGPRDPVTFGGSALALLAICLLAAWRPARHATRIDPAAVLRSH